MRVGAIDREAVKLRAPRLMVARRHATPRYFEPPDYLRETRSSTALTASATRSAAPAVIAGHATSAMRYAGR